MAVKKERSEWIQNMREAEWLGLVAKFRRGMLFHLTLTLVCRAPSDMQSLFAVRRETWCLIPGWLCLPVPFPYKVLFLLAHPAFIICLINV